MYQQLRRTGWARCLLLKLVLPPAENVYSLTECARTGSTSNTNLLERRKPRKCDEYLHVHQVAELTTCHQIGLL